MATGKITHLVFSPNWGIIKGSRPNEKLTEDRKRGSCLSFCIFNFAFYTAATVCHGLHTNVALPTRYEQGST